MAFKFRENQSVLHPRYMMMHGNWTVWHSNDGFWHYGEVKDSDRVKNGWHAGYYVIVVILVYGMSIIMLIASHINQKHQKLLEDRQIDKYLKEFQVVKERSSRDSYRNLKKAIVAKLHRGGSGGGGGADRSSNSSACLGGKSGGIYRCISKSVLPLTTLVFPSALSAASVGGDDVSLTHPISASRETLQTTKEKSRNETCLCNLYVIEEFEGEQKQGRSPAEETTVTQVNENSNHRYQRTLAYRSVDPAGKDHSHFKQHLVSQQCVKAEINIPPLLSRSRTSSDIATRYSPVGETTSDLITVEQYDVPIRGRYNQGEGTLPEFQKTAEQIHNRTSSSAKIGHAFGESLSVSHSQRNLTLVHLQSPKRSFPSSRSPSGARDRQVYGSSTGHHTDDVVCRSSYGSSIGSRNTNPVQISSV